MTEESGEKLASEDLASVDTESQSTYSTGSSLKSSVATLQDSFVALFRKALHVSKPLMPSGDYLTVGTKLCNDRFLIRRKIGEGGMGVVYEAYDHVRNELVACKTMKRLHPASVYFLKNEFRALCDVRHPNVLRLYEMFAENDTWFITMELVSGMPFHRYVRVSGAPDLERLRSALMQLLAAVRAIHAANELHRDLKPSNVLVTDTGRVVVLDFGLVSQPEVGGIGQTVAGDLHGGTPAYMSPEQAAGKPATRASDYYAIGVMLFEALTGRLPFEGLTGELLVNKQTSEAPRISTLTAVSAAWDQLCADMLSRDPEVRMRSLLEVETTTQQPLLPTAGAATQEATSSSPTAVADWTLHSQETVPASQPISSWDNFSSNPRIRLELLGRDQEIEQLLDAYRKTRQGRAVVVFVSGESGIGKSALVSSFTEGLHTTEDATVLAGRCYEREHVPYQGFDALIDALSRKLRKLASAHTDLPIPRDVFALARIFPVLNRVQAIAEAPTDRVLDLHDLKRRAFEAFLRLLAGLRARGPLVLVIDDMQWLDHESVRLMRTLLIQPEPVPYLLICMHRSEGAAAHPLLSSVYAAARENPALDIRSIAIGAMSHSSLVSLLQRSVPHEIDAPTADALARESLGSPFFASVLARVVPLHAPDLPLPSLRDALSTHIDALPAEARRLLSMVALVGRALPPNLLIEAANVQDGHSHLDHLRGEQLVRLSFGRDGERLVECYHDRIREHVTAHLEAQDQRELFLALARAMSAWDSEHAELIAYVMNAAGMHTEAVEHTLRAAEQAFATLAFNRAAKLYENALASGIFEDERRSSLLIARARALAMAGQGRLAAEAFLQAAERVPREESSALIRSAAEQFLLAGDLQRGRATLARALTMEGIEFHHTTGAALAAVLLSRTRLRLRGYAFTPRRQVDPVVSRRLELLRLATHGFLRTDQLRSLNYCARWAKAALDAGHDIEVGRALSVYLVFEIWSPAPSTAVIDQLTQVCTESYERTGDWMTRAYAGFGLAWQRTMVGDPEGALQDYERALELINANPTSTTSYDRAWFESYRILDILFCGRIAEAGELARVLFEDAVARGEFSVCANLLRVGCFAALAADKPAYAAQQIADVAARLPTEEPEVGRYMWLYAYPLPALYQGAPLEAWHTTAPHLEQFRASFMGRRIMRGMLERESCGWVVAAAQHTTDARQRRHMTKLAREYAQVAKGRKVSVGVGIPEAALACLRADRDSAIAALRAHLRTNPAPLHTQVAQRRLGELLGGREGAALVQNADKFLRDGGVLNPERFTAAILPGIELK